MVDSQRIYQVPICARHQLDPTAGSIEKARVMHDPRRDRHYLLMEYKIDTSNEYGRQVARDIQSGKLSEMSTRHFPGEDDFREISAVEAGWREGTSSSLSAQDTKGFCLPPDFSIAASDDTIHDNVAKIIDGKSYVTPPDNKSTANPETNKASSSNPEPNNKAPPLVGNSQTSSSSPSPENSTSTMSTNATTAAPATPVINPATTTPPTTATPQSAPPSQTATSSQATTTTTQAPEPDWKKQIEQLTKERDQLKELAQREINRQIEIVAKRLLPAAVGETEEDKQKDAIELATSLMSSNSERFKKMAETEPAKKVEETTAATTPAVPPVAPPPVATPVSNPVNPPVTEQSNPYASPPVVPTPAEEPKSQRKRGATESMDQAVDEFKAKATQFTYTGKMGSSGDSKKNTKTTRPSNDYDHMVTRTTNEASAASNNEVLVKAFLGDMPVLRQANRLTEVVAGDSDKAREHNDMVRIHLSNQNKILEELDHLTPQNSLLELRNYALHSNCFSVSQGRVLTDVNYNFNNLNTLPSAKDFKGALFGMKDTPATSAF